MKLTILLIIGLVVGIPVAVVIYRELIRYLKEEIEFKPNR